MLIMMAPYRKSVPLQLAFHKDPFQGPLLFIIYMNDIHEPSSSFKTILYAEDTNLISPLCLFSNSASAKTWKWRKYRRMFKHELNRISEWLNINNLSLNVKTKLMLFHYHQCNLNSLTPKLAINSVPIERQNVLKLPWLYNRWTPPSELHVDWKGFCRLIHWSLCRPLILQTWEIAKNAIRTIANIMSKTWKTWKCRKYQRILTMSLTAFWNGLI